MKQGRWMKSMLTFLWLATLLSKAVHGQTFCPPEWSEQGGPYLPESQVSLNGTAYQCVSSARSALCSKFQPLASQGPMAWEAVGPCISGFQLAYPALYFGSCPDSYMANATYQAGDVVELGGLVYSCKPYPDSMFCSNALFQPGKANSGTAWNLVGSCFGNQTELVNVTEPVKIVASRIATKAPKRITVSELEAIRNSYESPENNLLPGIESKWALPYDRVAVPTNLFEDDRCNGKPLNLISSLYDTSSNVLPTSVNADTMSDYLDHKLDSRIVIVDTEINPVLNHFRYPDPKYPPCPPRIHLKQPLRLKFEHNNKAISFRRAQRGLLRRRLTNEDTDGDSELTLDVNSWTNSPYTPPISEFSSKLAASTFQTTGKPLQVQLYSHDHSARFVKGLISAFEMAAQDVEIPFQNVTNNGTSIVLKDFQFAESGSFDPELAKLPLRLEVTLILLFAERLFFLSFDAYSNSTQFLTEYLEKLVAPPEYLAKKPKTNKKEKDCKDKSPTIAIIDANNERLNSTDTIFPFRVYPIQYAGMTVKDKVAKVRSEMTKMEATLTIFGAFDEVAYLLNIRTLGDFELFPASIAYATVLHQQVILYCDEERVSSPEVKDHLNNAGVIIRSHEAITQDIETHLLTKTNQVWVDDDRCNYAISRVIPAHQIIDSQTPITPMKACKNDKEMEGMRMAHVADGVAMARFLSWLTDTVRNRQVSEVEIDEKLMTFQAQQPGFLERSVPTIAAVGSNAAIPQYIASKDSPLIGLLDSSQPILIESGGQYEYGTTVVSRTWHFGEATQNFRNMYTRVLKGNIALDSTIFPENTPGFVLDAYARKPLWEVQQDYDHITGYGVGAALYVGEGPHSISQDWTNTEVIKKGMITTNGPGYYEKENFGITIENVLHVENAQGNGSQSTTGYLKFETLTMIPIQKNLINLDLMTDTELDWLDAYHNNVLQKVGPFLGGNVKKWLIAACQPIDRTN